MFLSVQHMCTYCPQKPEEAFYPKTGLQMVVRGHVGIGSRMQGYERTASLLSRRFSPFKNFLNAHSNKFSISKYIYIQNKFVAV